MLSPGNTDSLKKIEELTGAYLEKNQRDGSLTIYGSDSQTNMARIEINTVLSKIIDDGHNTFHEHLSQFPNGFVRKMLTEFDTDLNVLHAIEGVHEVRFLVGQRKLKIVSSNEGHVGLMEILTNLAARMPEAFQGEEEACPVCLTPPEGKERARLELCGHLYCSPCLAMQVMSAPWPLLCSFEVSKLINLQFKTSTFLTGMQLFMGCRRSKEV